MTVGARRPNPPKPFFTACPRKPLTALLLLPIFGFLIRRQIRRLRFSSLPLRW